MGIENLDECIIFLDYYNWDLMVGSNFIDEVYIFIVFLFVFFDLLNINVFFRFV